MLEVRRILVAHDFSPASRHALSRARAVAKRVQATVHLIHVETPNAPPFDSGSETPATHSEMLTRMKEDADGISEAHLVREILRGVDVASALLDYAADHDVDLIVIGTHGRRGVRRFFLGSVAEDVVRRAPCPVLTIRRGDEADDPGPDSPILVPLDFSTHSISALEHAAELAEMHDASLILLHVVEETLHPAFYGPALRSVYDAQPDIEEKAIARMNEVFQGLNKTGITMRSEARPGRAYREIVEVAKLRGASVIVMATHGRTGLDHYAMGGVAEKVVRSAPCAVFTVKSLGKSLLTSPRSTEEG